MTTAMPGTPRSLPSAARRVVAPATWRATLHHLLDGVVALAGGAVLFAGFGVSLLLIPVALIGLVVMAAFLRLVLTLAGWERARARVLLGLDVPAPVRSNDRATGISAWVRHAILDATAWRAVAYFVARIPLGIAASLGTAAAWLLGAALVTSAFWAGPLGGETLAVDRLVVDTWWEHLAATLLGVLIILIAPAVVGAFTFASRALVRSLLGPGADARIEELEDQRSSAVRTVDLDRRRIEQNLHDGAQVRLTALAMQLGLAREAIAGQAIEGEVADLVADAHLQAKLALREIRDLARGIHPAILTDRGVEAALSSMVGRLPIPVDLTVDIPGRPAPEVESIAFFVAAEAVTNAVRHSDSPSVDVRVARVGDQLVIEVRDRGRGGAGPAGGTGIAGLRERVEATGGRFEVHSPENVGTLVRAVVPCGS